MFYGTLILAKKGPLAKVWLAAHWDKKLTKAHVFETDVESTVDNIISPGVKLALRTSGHLLLGVVRIYSRKQKYLIQDLGEACAKIKMAFRPGIIDLPSASRAENPDALVLPEVFHNFDDTTLDMGVLEAQFTVNPSRMSEINIPDDTTTSGGTFLRGELETFGGDFGGGDFGGGMQDIEIDRNATSVVDSGREGSFEKIKGKDMTLVAMEDVPPKTSATVHEADEIYPDARNDFGEGMDGFGMTGKEDDGFGEFVDLPSVAELTREGGETRNEMEVTKVAENGEEEPMEVDEQQPKLSEDKQPAEAESNMNAATTTTAAVQEEEKEDSGFVLEPLEVNRTVLENRARRKRRVVVDNDKEFSGQQIKSQFEDFKDLLQPKCFPPPTKKAMMWREMAGCEQLYSHPTGPGLAIRLASTIKANYTTDIPGELPADTSFLELDKIDPNMSKEDKDSSKEHTSEIDKAEAVANDNAVVAEELPAGEQEVIKHDEQVREVEAGGFGEDMGMGQFDADNGLDSGVDREETRPSGMVDFSAPDENLQSEFTGDQMSNELSDEFEQRRWTKLTQQVLLVLERNFESSDSIAFSSLTVKCDRKQAASQFYTCLLLAKEGVIAVEQSDPYAEIHIQKGPKFI